MSRIGRLPIAVPGGVNVSVDAENVVTVKGPKGELKQKIHQDITVALEDGVINVRRPSDDKNHRALHGLSRSLINNMVVGVTEGYAKGLDIVGVGYRAQKQGKKVVLTVGYSHPVEVEEIPGIELEVPTPNKIVVKGIDKQLVGSIAHNIREIRKPEPYLGKGIKYETEVVRRKEGKTGKK
ncbi:MULTISPECIES: 50S ribosomal protein L6 [unclassified Clostridium]|uniref:50S ribosomal protein L6 n=1 Tax=unclassified Clostridium TaxID=2614128 RepID=UPI000822C783|nr:MULTISPECIES: 50S ribosomal protein L6 [unclassified Clostridium]SCJ64969.1 BL10 [uncultured Clostridium sp.]